MTNHKEESVGAFWEKKGKNDLQYFTGEVDGKHYVMFVNRYHRDGKNTPMFRVYAPKESQRHNTEERGTEKIAGWPFSH